jgi:hypothetical protein
MMLANVKEICYNTDREVETVIVSGCMTALSKGNYPLGKNADND